MVYLVKRCWERGERRCRAELTEPADSGGNIHYRSLGIYIGFRLSLKLQGIVKVEALFCANVAPLSYH